MFVFSFSSKHSCSARKQLILLFESRVERIPLQVLRDIPYKAQVYWSAEGRVEAIHEYTHALTQRCVSKNMSLLCPIPSFFGGSENCTRQKLTKIRIQGGTNKFRDIVGGGGTKDKELGEDPQQNPKPATRL